MWEAVDHSSITFAIASQTFSLISLCRLPGILHLRCVDWNRLSLILKPFPPPGSPEFPRLLGECLPWQELRKGLGEVWRHSVYLLAKVDVKVGVSFCCFLLSVEFWMG